MSDEVERLQAKVERLLQALTGAWLGYDAIPWQMATPEYDAMQGGVVCEHETGKRLERVYRMTRVDVDIMAARDDSSPESRGAT